MKTLLSAVVAASLAFNAVGAHADGKFGERQVALEIESTSLATALDKWAQQSGFQIFVQDWEAAKNLPAPGLKGTFTAQAALEQLLQGTQLTYVWLNEKAVAIRRKMPSTVPAALQRTGLEGQQAVPVAKFSGDGMDDAPKASTDARTSGRGDTEAGPRVARVEEMIVTGTYIRGIAPVGSHVNLYSREQIDQSGAGTIGQFARAMSENFSNLDGVANAASSNRYVRLNNDASSGNAFAGESFNIHGVGSAATLTLVDGRRLAPAGLGGAMTDVSLIPLSAVDRIEVMPDGASAIYGADAVAGVVNIVTRTDFEGAETRLRYGSSTDGGGGELTASQLLGAAWSTGNAFMGYEYRKQDALDASDRDYLPDQGGPYSLTPDNRRDSVFLSARQSVGEDTGIRAQAAYTDRSFSSDVTTNSLLSLSRSAPKGNAEQLSATLVAEHAFANGWIAELGGSYAKLRQTARDVQTVTSPFFSATISNLSRANADTYSFDLLFSGQLSDLPGGPVRVAVGNSFRNETFESLRVTTTFGVDSSFAVPEADRDVMSVHGEVLVPLVGPGNAIRGIRRVDLSLAARFDDYSDFGSTTNPKIGLSWEPTERLRLRASYGTSFKTPLLAQSHTPLDYVATPFPDAQSPFGLTNALVIQGGNPALEPEEAESFSAGLDWKPSGSGLVLSATYFDLRFTDRVALPPTAGLLGLADEQLQPFLVRSPPLAEVERYFDDPAFFGDLTGAGPAGVEAIIDLRYANIAVTRQSGLDLTAAYNFALGSSAVTVALGATRLFENELQSVETGPTLDLLNAFGQPLKWKGRGSITWVREPFVAALFVNYANSYDNTLFTPPEAIDSWTTGDFSFTYNTGDAAFGVFDNLSVGLTVTNVTDQEPPTVAFSPGTILPGEQPISFDAANSSPMGRFVSLLISKRW